MNQVGFVHKCLPYKIVSWIWGLLLNNFFLLKSFHESALLSKSKCLNIGLQNNIIETGFQLTQDCSLFILKSFKKVFFF